MPCRSDYMEPTKGERGAVTAAEQEVKDFLDEMTATLDDMREWVLNNIYQALPPRKVRALDRAWKSLSKYPDSLYGAAVTNNLVNGLRIAEDLWSDYGMLEDLLENSIKEGKPVPENIRMTIEVDQINHRRTDLKRLLVSLAEKGDTVRLRKVIDADPQFPLEPQLGFSPDEF